MATIAAPRWMAARAAQGSKINGVQIGVISYSFRSLPDQSAEAILRYCLELGINVVELMGDPAESFAGIQVPFDTERLYKVYQRSAPGKPPLSPAEQHEHDDVMAAYAEHSRQIATLRAKATMQPFEKLRRLYNDAGVSIYAFKPDAFKSSNSDAEVDYGMRAAKALGANHVTAEMPADAAQVSRLAAAAARHGLRIAYHAHEQASPTLWDDALAESPANAINLDLGHFVAADAYDPLPFIRQHHTRIASMHLKDRQTRTHGQANLPWGQGDTPITAALQLMRDQHYGFPAAIEFEYDVPAGSDALKEVGKCLDYCRRALA
jgi:sugar phosphate isomerase/epimerase